MRNKKVPIIKLTFLFLLIMVINVSTLPKAAAATNHSADRIYRSATEYDYPPFSVTSSGEADGFSVELLKAVAQEVGINVSFKIDQWNVLKDELKNGDLDILPLVGYTEERDEYYDFTVPYIVMHGNIFVRNNNTTINSEEDLNGKEIIVMEGDNAHEYAQRMQFSDNLILTKTYEEAFRLLSSGRHDAVLAQSLVGEMMIANLGLKNVMAVTQLGPDDLSRIKVNLHSFEQKFCFAVKEGDKELLAKLNEGLTIVSANGTYTELYNKWFPFLVDTVSVGQILLLTSYYMIPLLVLVLVGAIIIVKQQVKRKTAELETANHKYNQLEAQLRDQQKLHAIGTLAGGVAHEINNPINGIMNYSQLILDRINQTGDLADYAREIIHESERVSAIVRNLLQFSRLEKQSFSLARPEDIINETLSLIKTIIRHDQIELIVTVPPDLPWIRCRSQQIQQVLMNLLTNARDALNKKYQGYHEDKKMLIQCSVFDREGTQWLRIMVEDHGDGIPQDIRDRIYDPFFTTKDRTEGTGLGLSISFGIIRDHGGELSFETEDGRLTRFFIDLPATDPAEDEA
ncbi:MAG: transporter substrate-binding domain-containing protein [Bacillota bacterium]|nr:transporter substrate-binding domain-containing protein [Bacillota bacterium]